MVDVWNSLTDHIISALSTSIKKIEYIKTLLRYGRIIKALQMPITCKCKRTRWRVQHHIPDPE